MIFILAAQVLSNYICVVLLLLVLLPTNNFSQLRSDTSDLISKGEVHSQILNFSFPLNISHHIFNLLAETNGTGTIRVVAGHTATLPCDITPPSPREKATLILWFREDEGTPIFR